jgi:hypothetical protein
VIDLPEEERRAAVARLVRPGTVEPYSTHVLAGGAEARSAAARLERRVLGAGGVRLPEDDDVLVVVVEVASTTVAGVLRLGLAGGAGTAPLVAALRRGGQEVDPAHLWELASVAVHPAHRAVNGGAVALALYQGLAGILDRCDVRWLVARLDVAVLRVLTWYLAGMFEPIQGAEGSLRRPAEVLPVWCDVRAWRERLVGAEPEMAALLFEERGLADVVRPPDWSAVAPMLPMPGSPRRPG